MLWRNGAAAAATLALLAAASWLPARAEHQAGAALHQAADLARPAVPAPPAWPLHPSSPTQAVSAYFWSLSAAVEGNPGPGSVPPPATRGSASRSAPASGSASGSRSGSPSGSQGSTAGDAVAQPFARAYAYLAPEWQARLPFARFEREQAQLRHLDLLAVVAAGHPEGQPSAGRVFVEVRQLVTPDGGGVHLEFASGFYTTVHSSRGWQLSGGALAPETFGVLGPNGGEDPEAVAAAAAGGLARSLGRRGANATPKVRLSEGAAYRATADVRLGEDTYRVQLFRQADGRWVALTVNR